MINFNHIFIKKHKRYSMDFYATLNPRKNKAILVYDMPVRQAQGVRFG
ncbi:MAG: hypothetical protein HRU12_05490 [Phaeodactylibacter sp.]|nr:hypothetical protein [Phaeodactylibacter sp.]